MEVVSGAMGKERIHFEAPAAKKLDPEMGAFLDWFNGNTEGAWVVKAGMAHLWFVTIHSFEDGNGRIARAIADMALARSEQSSQRFYSMSAQIRQERADYYDIPERTQKATMDITPWMDWFWDAWACYRRSTSYPRNRALQSALLGDLWGVLAERTTATAACC
jgi:Fic family protein